MFMMYSVRKLRNLSKMKAVFNQQTDLFMYAACLLMQKAILTSRYFIETLNRKTNAFQAAGFEQFVNSSVGQRVVQSFVQDGQVFETFYQQMTEKAQKETDSFEYKQKIGEILQLDFQRMQRISAYMKIHL